MKRHADTRSRRARFSADRLAQADAAAVASRGAEAEVAQVLRRVARDHFAIEDEAAGAEDHSGARANQQRPGVGEFDRERAAAQHVGHAGRWIMHSLGPAAEPSMAPGGAAAGFELPEFCAEHCAAFVVDHQAPH